MALTVMFCLLSTLNVYRVSAKKETHASAYSMEKRPERRRMESLQSIPENEHQAVLNSVDTPTPTP